MNIKVKNPFKDLTKFELCLWISSVVIVTGSYLLSPSNDYLNLIASVVGVTSLIFIAKGYVIGQLLMVLFSVLYGLISFYFQYYGEMITYLGMTAPIAVFSAISWLKHPYKGTDEVEISRMTKKQGVFMLVLAVAVTGGFYFILKAMGTANLFFSTVSVATSFVAAYMGYMRSPFCSMGYALNDIILIVLWVFATIEDISYLPMIACFVVFFVNDLYGFINWLKMQKRQENCV